MRKTHELKVIRLFYDDVEADLKKVEIRFDDRGYEVGDILILREWDNNKEQYTGKQCTRIITNKVSDYFAGLTHGYVALSIRPLEAADEM